MIFESYFLTTSSPLPHLERAHHGAPGLPTERAARPGLVLAVGGGHLVELGARLDLLEGLKALGLEPTETMIN